MVVLLLLEITMNQLLKDQLTQDRSKMILLEFALTKKSMLTTFLAVAQSNLEELMKKIWIMNIDTVKDHY